MKNKELIQLINAQKPAISQTLDECINNRLARLKKEEQAMKKRAKFSAVLIAAVVFVSLMGTAFALGYSRLMDYLAKDNLKPIDRAQKLIQSDFGEAITQKDIVFHVEEAIYDGNTAVVQMLISPVDPENVFLLHQGIQDTPEDVYDVEYILDAYGGEYRKVIGRKDGKQIVSYSVSLTNADEEADYLFESNTMDAEELSDGSVRVWMEGNVVSGTSEKLDLLVRSTYAPLDEMNDLKNRQVFEKRITLACDQRAVNIDFQETENSMDARVRVLSANVQMYALRGEMMIEYLYQPDIENEPMGITFKLYNGEDEIDVGSGGQETLETSSDGYNRYRTVFEIEAFEAFPETIALEAKVIGKPVTLGQAVFSATEMKAKAEETTVSNESERYLYFAPQGSRTGKEVTFLDGEIHLGGSIELSYAYDGERTNLPNIRLTEPDGSYLGEIVSQTTVIKKDSYTVQAQRNGSGWPPSVTVEFVLDGKVIDSFDCNLYPAEK